MPGPQRSVVLFCFYWSYPLLFLTSLLSLSHISYLSLSFSLLSFSRPAYTACKVFLRPHSHIQQAPLLFLLSNKKMSSRQGGKQKPLKAPKKDRGEETDDDAAFKQRQREQQKAEKEAIAKLKKK